MKANTLYKVFEEYNLYYSEENDITVDEVSRTKKLYITDDKGQMKEIKSCKETLTSKWNQILNGAYQLEMFKNKMNLSET